MILGVTALLIGRRKEELFVEEEIIPDDVWAKRDEDVSDDVLAEMAGMQNNDSQEWSNEDLLSVGWTQEQIDVYRKEMQSPELEIQNDEEE